MTFAKKLIASAVLGLCALGAAPVSAEVLTFDDLPVFANPGNYGGLQWNNVYTLSSTYHPNSGYQYGTVSPHNVIFNSGGSAASFYSDNAFSLQSLYLTKAWNDGYTNFEGYVGNNLVYSKSVFTTTTSPTLVEFDWTNLNMVVFSDGNNTYQSVIDNMTINEVPEPASGAMILGGLAIMGLVSRRRSRAAK